MFFRVADSYTCRAQFCLSPTTVKTLILPLIALFALQGVAASTSSRMGLIASAQIAGSGLTSTAVLQATEVHKLLPDSVFFQGRQLPVQFRNSQGVRFPGGMYLLAALVDSTGHNTPSEGCLAYLVSEVALDVNGHRLKPGVYGIKFDDRRHFVMMDIAAHRVFAVKSERDSILYRPKPLQILFDSRTDRYRLYLERNYVSVARSGDSLK